MHAQLPGVYRKNDAFYTLNTVPGTKVYGEKLVQDDGVEYRRWDYNRSKASAALKKGLQHLPFEADNEVLYLGASTGTTVSHVSDIVTEGIVYAVEYSPNIIRKLVALSETRVNIAPILGDARKPREYASLCSTVDVLYQDVAQKNQVAMLKKNTATFLKDDGHALIAIKAQSISSSQPAEQVFEDAKEQLSQDFEIVEGKKLAPFHTDHLFLVLKPA